ncbi:MAG: hypothetical protein IJE62_05440 [Clostridia bacterium]|nr:hypothetical protein [Clostridia bacterium]
MPILIRSIVETIKTFVVGCICSVVFSLMIYSDLAISDTFVCLVLNTIALFLFLHIHFVNWSGLFVEARNKKQYFIPTITASSVYIIVSSFFYSRRYKLYMWFFLPTRFLEPKLNIDYAVLSVVIAHTLFFLLAIFTPKIYNRQKNKR